MSEEGEKTRYGPYEIVKPIGKGKFAVVYRAKRVSDDEVVALKRINVDSVDDKARDKCLKEVGFLQSLDHPNIIKYMDSFINDNDLVIVFEWAAAGDLKRQLRKAQERGVGFEERIIWKYFSQICNAMEHMHERRIMHRDLKPANIFLTLDGTVKVGDLGLSREMSENTIQAHSKVGTPLYMSPEVLKGDGYDFKSDIWSLGCILYELAMLKSPFKAEGLNLYSLFQKISKGDYQPLPEQYSDELKDLAYKMISTAPEDRPEIEHSCVIAQEMRSIYSDKALAAKRQAQQLAKQKMKAEEEGAEVNYGAEAKEDREGTGDAKGGGQPAKAGAVGAEEPQEYVPSASRQHRGGVDKAEAKEQATPSSRANEDDWAVSSPPTGAGSRSDSASSATTGATRGGGGAKGVEDDWAQSQPRRQADRQQQQWSAEAPVRKGGSSAAVAPMPQSGDPGYDMPAGFEREEPRKRQIAAPAVTRRMKNSPSPKKTSSPERRADREPASSGAAAGGGANNRRLDLNDNETTLPRVANEDTRDEAIMTSIKDSYVAFALSETLYQKLVVMGCPLDESGGSGGGSPAGLRRNRKPNGQGRMLPMHFAVDLSSLGSVAGHGRGRSEQHFQFQRFTTVSLWLLENIGGRAAQLGASVDVESSTPMMIAKQLLMAAGEAGVAEAVLQDVTPTSLMPGFGEKVCLLLLGLIERCTQAMNIGVRPLRYERDDTEAEGENVDGVNEGDDDEDDDEVEEEVSLSTGVGSPGRAEWRGAGGKEDGFGRASADEAGDGVVSILHKDSSLHQIIVAAVDETAWREETERVAPALAKAKQSRAGAFGGEWSDHLQSLQAYSKLLNGESTAAMAGASFRSGREDGNVFSIVTSNLALLERALKGQLEQVGKAESMLNIRNGLSRLGNEYGNFKAEATALETTIADKSAKLQQLTDSLAAVDEKLGEVLEAMEDKHGQSGNGSGGNSQATKMRAAIKRIKEEIAEMSVSIGITENMVMMKRQQAAHSKRVQHKAKAASRARHRKRGNKHDED